MNKHDVAQYLVYVIVACLVALMIIIAIPNRRLAWLFTCAAGRAIIWIAKGVAFAMGMMIAAYFFLKVLI